MYFAIDSAFKKISNSMLFFFVFRIQFKSISNLILKFKSVHFIITSKVLLKII